MRAQRDQELLDWLTAQPSPSIFTTAITEAEIRYGIAPLPVGRRRSALLDAASHLLEARLADRVLPFDSDAASAFAEIVVGRRRAGRPIGQSDAQIAAIARSRGATVATRNVKDFEGCGVAIVNPWAAGTAG